MESTANILLTEAEAAHKILAQKATLTKWRFLGRGPAFVKLCGKIRYRLSDIEAFIEQSRVDPRERVKSRRRTIPARRPATKARKEASAA